MEVHTHKDTAKEEKFSVVIFPNGEQGINEHSAETGAECNT
jgi:hypothetical protein